MPERDAARRLGRGAQPDERVGGVAVRVAPGLEVVAGPDGVEAGALRGEREVEQAAGRELLGGRLVAEGQDGGIGFAPSRMVAICRPGARWWPRPDGRARTPAGSARERQAPRPQERPARTRRSGSTISRAPAGLAQAHHAPGRRQQHRRLAQRRDDRERRPAERGQHEPVGANVRKPPATAAAVQRAGAGGERAAGDARPHARPPPAAPPRTRATGSPRRTRRGRARRRRGPATSRWRSSPRSAARTRPRTGRARRRQPEQPPRPLDDEQPRQQQRDPGPRAAGTSRSPSTPHPDRHGEQRRAPARERVHDGQVPAPVGGRQEHEVGTSTPARQRRR